MNTNNKHKESASRIRGLTFRKKLLSYFAITIAAAVVIGGGWYGYLYASTPEHIRKPTYQHYHFRTQIVVEGKAVDFSEDKFQEETGQATACSAEVGSIPIDFHDKIDQLTHVHWNGMTGGEFLKYFGWNFIGGNEDLLGRRYDDGIVPQPVKIFGNLLPDTAEKAKFYIYVGDHNSYKQKKWDDFLNQDLETFFGKKSNIGHSDEVSTNNIINLLIPSALAHGGGIDKNPSKKSEKELKRINNLIGNVVIFAQEERPSDEQIKARFNDLVPLHDSTCGD